MLEFANGTPEAVKEWIRAWLAEPDLGPECREMLTRLATHPAMTNLWKEKIPAQPTGKDTAITTAALIAYERSLGLQPPIPRSRAALAQHLKQYPAVMLRPSDIGRLARMVNECLVKIPSSIRSRWAENSPSGTTFEEAARQIEDVARVLDLIDVKAKEIEAAFDLPKQPRRRGAKKTQRTYFGRIMSVLLERIYGQTCDPVLTIIEDVVFDLKGEIEEGTARSRRRGAKARP